MLCACGCGGVVISKRKDARYIHTHYQKSPSFREQQRQTAQNRFLHDTDFQAKMAAVAANRRGKPGKPITEENKRLISLTNTKYHFQFTAMSPELAYLLGTYTTDGSIGNHGSTFDLAVADLEFADKAADCILKLAPNQHIHRSERPPRGRNKVTLFRVTFSNVQLCSWLLTITERKGRVPDCIMDADVDSQRAYLGAIFDGDGSSARSNVIYVATSFHWIFGVHELCTQLGMQPHPIHIQQYLSGDRPYYRFEINKDDFYNAGVHFTILRKEH